MKLDIGELTPPERQLWDAFPAGTEVDLRSDRDEENDPDHGHEWGEERTVRAEVIVAMLLGVRETEPGRVAGLLLRGARITGTLSLDYAEFPYYLQLRDCRLEQTVRLYGARTRHLSFPGSHIPRLSCSYAVIDGHLRLSGMRGTLVQVDGAQVSGTFFLDRARLANPGGLALKAARLRVGEDILMRGGFTAEGGITLRGARIGGAFDLTAARISDPGGTALEAGRLQVGGDLSAAGLHTEGMVALPGASVTGTVFLAGAHLHHPAGRALYASALQVGAGLHLRDGFTATGQIRLSAARLDGGLDLRNARIAHPGGTVLNLRHAHVREVDLLTDGTPEGALDLRHAAIGLLRDAPDRWPDSVWLDGATYEQLETPLTATERLPWLTRDRAGYLPQPYEQLAAAYRRLGHERDSRSILFAKQRARRAQLPWYARAWGLLQDATVGYGYRPARAFAWLLALLVCGGTVFATHPPQHLGPGSPATCGSLAYTVDLLLPVGGIGDCQDFAPRGGEQWFAYLLTAAGWTLATTVTAGVARSVNRG